MMTFTLTSNKMDGINKMVNDVVALTKRQVLVGVPEEKDPRKAQEGIGNAGLARIHDKGSPLANIPARPFMKPGITKAQDRINNQMLAAAKAGLNKDEEQVELHLEKAGMLAQNGIRSIINTGEGFAPLKRGTLTGRLRKRKAAKKWDNDKREEVMASLHPLVDTGQLRNSIIFIVEGK